MGKGSRIRGQHSASYFDLYSADTSLGWRVIKKVSSAVGEQQVVQGKWREVYDAYDCHIGYQILAVLWQNKEQSSRPTSCVIVQREMLLIAGRAFKKGRSKTAGMTEEQRITRRDLRSKVGTGRALPPEDAVEKAQEKLKQYESPASRIDDGKGAAVFGDRAVRVYPKKS